MIRPAFRIQTGSTYLLLRRSEGRLFVEDGDPFVPWREIRFDPQKIVLKLWARTLVIPVSSLQTLLFEPYRGDSRRQIIRLQLLFQERSGALRSVAIALLVRSSRGSCGVFGLVFRIAHMVGWRGYRVSESFVGTRVELLQKAPVEQFSPYRQAFGDFAVPSLFTEGSKNSPPSGEKKDKRLCLVLWGAVWGAVVFVFLLLAVGFLVTIEVLMRSGWDSLSLLVSVWSSLGFVMFRISLLGGAFGAVFGFVEGSLPKS